MRPVTLILCCLLALASLAAAQQSAQTPTSDAESKMTNAAVIQMVTAGLSEQIITTSIRQAPAKDFDLTPTGLIALKKAGVPDTVIVAMQEIDASVKSDSSDADKMSTDIGDTAHNDPNAKVRQELVLIEDLVGKASIAGDKATLAKFLADDYTLFQDGKSYTKAQYLELVKPLKNITTTDIENVNLRFEGETVALTAISVLHAKNGSIFKLKFTDKFVKSDGQWKVVASQISTAEATVAQPEKPPAAPAPQDGCAGIEMMGLFKNEIFDRAMGGGITEWLVKIRNNTAVTKIVIFGWRDQYGQEQTSQVQIRGGEIASPRVDMTQARYIAPATDVKLVSCQ